MRLLAINKVAYIGDMRNVNAYNITEALINLTVIKNGSAKHDLRICSLGRGYRF